MLNRGKQRLELQKTPPYIAALAIGIVFVFVGIFLLVALSADWKWQPALFRVIAVFCVGVVTLFYSLMQSRRKSILCVGIFLTLLGLFLLLVDTKVIPFPLDKVWPVVVVLGGISLFVTGMYMYRGVRFSWTVPSLAMTLLGLCFLPFSLDLVTTPFVVIVRQWWPILFIVGGGCLIALFFVWNNKYFQKIRVDEADDEFSDLEQKD